MTFFAFQMSLFLLTCKVAKQRKVTGHWAMTLKPRKIQLQNVNSVSCRRDTERKAHEMAVLVADLQRMRSVTARDAEEEAQMTRYQEEMLARVMELHMLAKAEGGPLPGQVAM